MEEQETKRCPYCGEIIKATAQKCIHCKSWIIEKQETRVLCPFCHNPVPEYAEKCSNCGEWLIDDRIHQSKGFWVDNPVVIWINWIWVIFGIILVLLSIAGQTFEGFIGAILFTVVGYIFSYAYMLPSIYAASREHPQFVPILLVNILFGGTIIGWVGAMVWASTHRVGRHTHW